MKSTSASRTTVKSALILLLVASSAVTACGRGAGGVDSTVGEGAGLDGSASEEVSGMDDANNEEPNAAAGDGAGSKGDASDSLSPERIATLGSWVATQDAETGGDLLELMQLAEGGGTPEAPSAFAPGGETSSETPYDGMALEAATGLFATSLGRANVDVQNLALHVLTVSQLARLRGMPPMPLGTRGGNANIWVIVFDTAEPITAGVFLPENIDELTGLSSDSLLAGPDGLTTVYYILSLSDDVGDGRFVGVGKGVVNDRTIWSRADLEAMDAEESH